MRPRPGKYRYDYPDSDDMWIEITIAHDGDNTYTDGSQGFKNIMGDSAGVPTELNGWTYTPFVTDTFEKDGIE